MGLTPVSPRFGTGLIWVPAALMLVVEGQVTQRIIGTPDNVVRLSVVGRSTSVPSYLARVTTLGGPVNIGLTGLSSGRAGAALSLSAWKLFAETTRHFDPYLQGTTGVDFV